MTTLIVDVEDDRAESLKKILQEFPFVEDVVEKTSFVVNDQPTQYERIKKLVDEAQGKDLFKDIVDPSEWQREIRKEWDRDF